MHAAYVSICLAVNNPMALYINRWSAKIASANDIQSNPQCSSKRTWAIWFRPNDGPFVNDWFGLYGLGKANPVSLNVTLAVLYQCLRQTSIWSSADDANRPNFAIKSTCTLSLIQKKQIPILEVWMSIIFVCATWIEFVSFYLRIFFIIRVIFIADTFFFFTNIISADTIFVCTNIVPVKFYPRIKILLVKTFS